MKKITIIALMLISFFACPLWSHADYIIHLKHGGQFMTPKYWTDDGQIQFFVRGGTMGIERDTVKAIEKSIIDDDQTRQPEQSMPRNSRTRQDATNTAPDAEGKSGPNINLKEEKVDLKTYQDKMAVLNKELYKTLISIKKAKSRKDQYEIDRAKEENRKVSDEMWKLTNELKAKNKGKLPDDWWAATGKEPAQ